MLEFVEIYWRRNVIPLVNEAPSMTSNDFVVIFLCRQFGQVAKDALNTGVIYSRLRPNDDEFMVFDQLPKRQSNIHMFKIVYKFTYVHHWNCISLMSQVSLLT